MNFIYTIIVVVLCCATANGKLRVRDNAPEHRELQNATCFSFTAPTFMDLNAYFLEFSLNASTAISSYVFHVDTNIASLDSGFLTSWTLYGSNGNNGTAPISPSDPTWVLVDSQSDIDFSLPQNPLNPGLFTYTFVNGTVIYQYFGFVSTLIPPMNPFEALKQYTNPVTQVDFCS